MARFPHGEPTGSGSDAGADHVRVFDLPATGRWMKVKAAVPAHCELTGRQDGSGVDRYHLSSTQYSGLTGSASTGLHTHPHSALEGLTNDGHPQYILANGTRAFTSTVSGQSPTAPAHLATRGYVDGAISGISGEWGPGVQNTTALAAVGPSARADKQVRLVEDSGALYRYDAQASTGDVRPNDAPATGWWIKTASSTQDHALLVNLQGGTTSQYYHLTLAQHDGLTDGGSTALHKHDHGGMDGLGDDDHTQYLLSSGARALAGDLSFAGYQAINLRVENIDGTSVPSPVSGNKGWLYFDTTANELVYSDGTNNVRPSATAGANQIPVTGSGGTIAIGYIPTGQTGTTVPLGNDSRFPPSPGTAGRIIYSDGSPPTPRSPRGRPRRSCTAKRPPRGARSLTASSTAAPRTHSTRRAWGGDDRVDEDRAGPAHLGWGWDQHRKVGSSFTGGPREPRRRMPG